MFSGSFVFDMYVYPAKNCTTTTIHTLISHNCYNLNQRKSIIRLQRILYIQMPVYNNQLYGMIYTYMYINKTITQGKKPV